MDALEFLKERKRMCDYYSHCKGCPLDGSKCTIDSTISDEDCKRFAATVEQWSKEHPRKTRQSEFLKLFPNAKMWEYGDFIDICPKLLNEIYQCGVKRGQTCYECCKEYWGEMVE